MKKLLYPSVLAVLAGMTAGQAAAQEMFDWSGFYVGGGVGVVQSDSNADIVYGVDGGGETAAWSASDGYFTGDIYDDVDGSSITLGSSTDSLALGALEPWLTHTDLSSRAWAASGYAGAQMQFGNIVVGGEVRGTLGDLGTSYSDSWTDDTSDSGSVSDPESPTLSGSLPSNVNWTGDSNISVVTNSASIDGTVNQDNSLAFGTSYDGYFAPVAKVGFAADRFMLFAMAGPAVAQVTATTSASVDETGNITVTANASTVGDLDGAASYDWSGSNTETLWGYTLGAGVEVAATDNVVLRFEGSMTDLGSIDVTGASEDTDATYKVTQSVANYSIMTGVSFKF